MTEDPGGTADHADVESGYRSRVRHRIAFLAILVVLTVVSVIVSIAVGSVSIPVSEVWSVIASSEGGTAHTIVWNIRIPRLLAAVVVGAGLSVAGVVMQSVLKNPLGSPFTLGISHAAMFGAAVSIVAFDAGSINQSSSTFIAFNNPYVTTISAFAFSLFSAGVILALAKYKSATPETMILTGVALGSLFTAGTTAIQYFASTTELASIVYWSFGDVGRATWRNLTIMTAATVPAAAFFLYNNLEYDALDAGDRTAKGLGVEVESVRNRGMLIASFITALSVSFVGIIGFVGLVVPHVVRKLIGNTKRYLIPGSCLMGSILLVASDTASRTVLSPTVVPVGIVTAFVGAPFFIFLVIRGKEYW